MTLAHVCELYWMDTVYFHEPVRKDYLICLLDGGQPQPFLFPCVPDAPTTMCGSLEPLGGLLCPTFPRTFLFIFQ